MHNNLRKILKVVAVTGIVTAGIFALISSEETKEFFKKSLQKLKKSSGEDDDDSDDAKAKLLLIAKQINRDIKKTECRTSEKSHDINKKKYEKMNWGEDIISRDDIIKN